MPDIIALANASEGIKSYAEAKERGDKLEMDRQRLQVESTLGAMQVQTQKEELFQRTQQSQQEFGLQEERFAFEKERMQPIIESNKVALKTLQDTQKALINQMNMTSKFETLYDELRAKFLSGEGEEGKLGEKQMRTGMEADIEKGETEIELAKETRGEPATTARQVKRETEAALGPLEVLEKKRELTKMKEETRLLGEQIALMAPKFKWDILKIQSDIRESDSAADLTDKRTELLRIGLPHAITQIQRDLDLTEARTKWTNTQIDTAYYQLGLQYLELNARAASITDPMAKSRYDDAVQAYHKSIGLFEKGLAAAAKKMMDTANRMFEEAGVADRVVASSEVTIERPAWKAIVSILPRVSPTFGFEALDIMKEWPVVAVPIAEETPTTTEQPTTPTTMGPPQPEVTSVPEQFNARDYISSKLQTFSVEQLQSANEQAFKDGKTTVDMYNSIKDELETR